MDFRGKVPNAQAHLSAFPGFSLLQTNKKMMGKKYLNQLGALMVNIKQINVKRIDFNCKREI